MRLCVTALITAVLVAGTPAWAELKIGDPAPALPVTEWLKGQPQSLTRSQGSKIFILEFWATWCLPCIQDIPKLTALQERYRDQGVVIIGITSPGSRQQRLSDVKRFIGDRGDSMGYTLAWDQPDAATRNYLEAAGAMAIPYRFVIDRRGRIAWHGYSSPDFDRVLAKLVAGTFDITKEVNRAKNDVRIQELLLRYRSEAMGGDWEGALEILNQVVEIDPARFNPVREVQFVFLDRLKDPARLRLWIERFIDKYSDNTDALVNITGVLLGIQTPERRLPDVLLRAARTALEAGKGQDMDACHAYAQAAHRLGHLDEAIRVQKQAVELAAEPFKAAATTWLEYYQACKELRDTKFSSPPP